MTVRIEGLDAPGLTPYSRLTEAQLRNDLNPAAGLMVVESPKVILTALNAGCRPVSLLCEERHIEGDAREIISCLDPEVPVYTGSRGLLASLTGYTLTRGVLCAMKRPELPGLEEVARNASRLAVLVDVCDTTNIGSIFRSAAALGVDGVVMMRGSCDPLNRRAVRVSMGTVFQIPWCWADNPRQLQELGFETVALALRDRSVPIDDPELKKRPRLAMMLGTEGDGLPGGVMDKADWVVKIPMHHGVDSLNVGSAAALAFWELKNRE